MNIYNALVLPKLKCRLENWISRNHTAPVPVLSLNWLITFNSHVRYPEQNTITLFSVLFWITYICDLFIHLISSQARGKLQLYKYLLKMGLLAKQEITLVFLDVRVKRSPFVCVYNNVGLFYTTPSMFGLFFLTYVFFSSKNSYYYFESSNLLHWWQISVHKWWIFCTFGIPSYVFKSYYHFN